MSKSCKPQYMAQSKSQNMTMIKFLGKYTSIPSTKPGPTVKNGYKLLIQESLAVSFQTTECVHKPVKIIKYPKS